MKKKSKYWLYRRGKYWWIQNAETKKQESLHTENRNEAERLRNAREDAEAQPALAVALGRVYTTAADPNWQNASGRKSWTSNAKVEAKQPTKRWTGKILM
jgi:hypothetical protein